jgi:hypothetical protein
VYDAFDLSCASVLLLDQRLNNFVMGPVAPESSSEADEDTKSISLLFELDPTSNPTQTAPMSNKTIANGQAKGRNLINAFRKGGGLEVITRTVKYSRSKYARKFFVTILSFLAFALLLAACGKENQGVRTGALEWKKVSEVIEMAPGEVMREVTFPVINRGADTVRIKHVETDCGCILASGSELVLIPGVEREVKVQFRPTPAMGSTIQTKDLIVRLEDMEVTARLRLMVKVAATLTASSAAMVWDASDQKVQVVSLKSSLPFALRDVRCSSSGFSWEINPLAGEHQQFDISVRSLGNEIKQSLLLFNTSLPAPWNQIGVMLKTQAKRRDPAS